MVEANGGFKVLSPALVEFRGDELPCEVDLLIEVRNGSVVCKSVILRESTDPITADTLRAVPLATLAARASVWATSIDDEDLAMGRRPLEKQDRIAATLRSRKHRITTALLTEVAEIYKAAPEWPTKAVADQMNVSRSTAATWVGLARKHTPPLLPPATSASATKGSR